MNRRNEILDIAKGIGILLVVFGHLNITFNPTIYKFHMSLFFIISGWCISENHTEHFVRFVIKKFEKILLPALLFTGLFYFLKFVDYDYWSYTLDNYHLLGTTWFLKDLFKSSVIMLTALCVSKKIKIVKDWSWPFIFLFSAYGFSYFGILSPALNLYITFYLGVGFTLKKYYPSLLCVKETNTKTLLSFCMALGILFLSKSWSPGHITGCTYTSYLPYILLSFIGTYVVLVVSQWLSLANKLKNIFVTLGQNTMPIVLFQWSVFWIVDLLVENNYVVFTSAIVEHCAKFFLGIGLPLLADSIYTYAKSKLVVLFTSK